MCATESEHLAELSRCDRTTHRLAGESAGEEGGGGGGGGGCGAGCAIAIMGVLATVSAVVVAFAVGKAKGKPDAADAGAQKSGRGKTRAGTNPTRGTRPRTSRGGQRGGTAAKRTANPLHAAAGKGEVKAAHNVVQNAACNAGSFGLDEQGEESAAHDLGAPTNTAEHDLGAPPGDTHDLRAPLASGASNDATECDLGAPPGDSDGDSDADPHSDSYSAAILKGKLGNQGDQGDVDGAYDLGAPTAVAAKKQKKSSKKKAAPAANAGLATDNHYAAVFELGDAGADGANDGFYDHNHPDAHAYDLGPGTGTGAEYDLGHSTGTGAEYDLGYGGGGVNYDHTHPDAETYSTVAPAALTISEGFYDQDHPDANKYMSLGSNASGAAGATTSTAMAFGGSHSDDDMADIDL